MTDTADSHAADLIIGAFFFAMRACEYSVTPLPGRTVRVTLGHIAFRDSNHRLLSHHDPCLPILAHSVTITFADQKNRHKSDSRTQHRSGDSQLCPIRRWAAVVQRIVATVPNYGPTTPACAYSTPSGTRFLTIDHIRSLLRRICLLFGGRTAFGFDPHEIGTRSIRSGAAMSLFLNNHSPSRIMLLGRWSSDAFLVYLRPQVLEWTHSMSSDMVRFDQFWDAGRTDTPGHDDPSTRQHHPIHGPRRQQHMLSMPQFYLHH